MEMKEDFTESVLSSHLCMVSEDQTWQQVPLPTDPFSQSLTSVWVCLCMCMCVIKRTTCGKLAFLFHHVGPTN